MKRRNAIVAVLFILAACQIPGCNMLPSTAGDLAASAAEAQTAADILAAEIEGLKADLEALSESNPEAAAVADQLVAMINDKSEQAEKWRQVFNEAQTRLQTANSGWDFLEVATGVAAGLFPPLAVGVPIIRRSRQAFDGVVASVAAGGGPVDPQAVRDAMSHYPGLKERVTATRVRIGDKKIEAVKV